VFLLAAVLLRHARTGERAARLAAFGLILTFVASAVQIGRVALHPVYFNHNALYHAVQAIALALLYVALRDFIAGASRPLASPC
jgi:kynureninase